MQRRTFLQTTAAAASAMRVLGANDRVNIGVIGVRGRGRDHITSYAKLPNTRIAGICDIDQAQRERALQLVGRVQPSGGAPQQFDDLRKMFDSKDIDVVSIATCNHWHALATVWACQAGKDVYVEKPACHNIFEGGKMVEAARKYNRMVQVGMQSRTTEHVMKAMELLHGGAIGKIYLAKGLCFKRRKPIGHSPDGPVPPGVDYNIWLGPAAMRPFNPNRFHYNWHWFWDTGNGDIGNQGIHQMDVARWGLGKGLPKSVVSTGGKYYCAPDDDQETANTQIATFDYGDAELVFEVRGGLTGGEGTGGGNLVGNLYYGTEGFMSLDHRGFQIYKGERRELAQEMKPQEKPGWDTAPHMANFLDAVRSRDYKKLHGDVEIGVNSATLVHMANTSYRLGRRLEFDPDRVNYGLDAVANYYLTRQYRKPFVVPEKV